MPRFDNAVVKDRQGGNLGIASAQWASRPDDQRYLDLESLRAAVARRAPERLGGQAQMREVIHPLQKIRVGNTPDGDLFITGHNGSGALFTNWSFGQYNRSIGGPDIRWLRDMPAPVVRETLAATVQFRGTVDEYSEAKLYYAPPVMTPDDTAMVTPGEVRAFTSPTYGRIWDLEVVDAVRKMNTDGRWVVPGKIAGGGLADNYTSVSKLSTTLYASDRDVWLFLVDESRPIEVNGQTLFRGFITYNSEVGSQTFGIITFLFNKVCQNRCIWGATEVKELTVRHTKGGPARFAEQAIPALTAYSEGSAQNLIQAIKLAQTCQVVSAPTAAEKVKAAEIWLQERGGFGQLEAKTTVQLAQMGGDTGSTGDPTTLWNLVQGATAYARGIPHTDTRVDFERKAGRLLDLVK